jgi:hypothetical protein
MKAFLTACTFLLWTLVGCGGAPSGAAQAALESAWGPVLRLGQAEQAAAPTIALIDNRLSFIWVGGDASGIHHDGVTWESGTLSDRVVLPLPPRNPFALQTLPGATGTLHHLWLDQNAAGELRLYSALLGLPLSVQRGPIEVTEQTTRRFAAARLPDDTAWVVASGGLDYAPSLYAHWLDNEGRPRLENIYQIASEADYPALLTAPDGTLYVFWLHTAENRVYRAVLLPNGQVDAVQPLMPGLALDPADRLESFYAAADLTHTYLFWNAVTAEGRPRTWYTAARAGAVGWPAPRPLEVSVTDSTITTGFNAGTVLAVEAGSESWGYVRPVEGMFANLPTTAYNPAGQVGVMFWQGGEPAGYVQVSESHLIGPPQLAVDRDLYLYLTWSAPNEAGSADMLAASLLFNQ